MATTAITEAPDSLDGRPGAPVFFDIPVAHPSGMGLKLTRSLCFGEPVATRPLDLENPAIKSKLEA